MMTNAELIQKAAAVIRPHRTKNGGLFGDVGCALVAAGGRVYVGVCADSGANVFCAEKNAIGSMITDGHYVIETIVAVWKDEHGDRFVISPCGNCRQFMLEVDPENLKTKVILDRQQVVLLEDLLPHHNSWKRQESL